MKYDIIGNNMQNLKVHLDANEKLYADAGKLVSKDRSVKMTPKMSGGIIGAFKREAGGASAFLTQYEAIGSPGAVSLAGELPGKILPIELKQGDSFIAEHYAFIAAQDTINITMQFVKLTAAMFGGAGFILQKLEGPGIAFINVVGDIVEYQVTPDNPLEIDPGHIAGFDPSLKYSVTFVDNFRTIMFGGIGLFLAKFEGQGKVIAHSVSRYKFAAEIYTLGLQQQPKK